MNDQLYKETILDHNKNPRHFGTLKHGTHEACAVNALCGDEVTMQLRVEKRRVTDIAFSGRGCAISTAAASLLTDAVLGKPLTAVSRLGTKEVDALLGVKVGPAREMCAYLPLDALKQAAARAK